MVFNNLTTSKNEKSILDLDNKKAKEVFFSNHFYTNSNLLESYWDFEPLLNEIEKKYMVFFEEIDNTLLDLAVVDNNINNSINVNEFPSIGDFKDKTQDKVNYVIDIKKDNYVARPITFINPILYVWLVNKITEDKNWTDIQEFFKNPWYYMDMQNKNTQGKDNLDDFNKKIECKSNKFIYSEYKDNNKTKIQKVNTVGINWWHQVEQESLAKSLQYSCYINADIANFYPSIYTHSISWALYSKAKGKEDKNEKNLANNIDALIRCMQFNQSNGIPQGSQLMDFVAEILLKGIDRDLYINIKNNKEINTDYYIIRYRDDYRIFAKNILQARLLLAELVKTLKEYGLHINDKKTNIVEDIITYSIKSDKLHTLPFFYKPKSKAINLQVLLLHINQLSKSYCNGAQVVKYLNLATNAVTIKSKYSLFEIFTELALLRNVKDFINPTKYLAKWFLKTNTVVAEKHNYKVLISIVVEIALYNSKPQILDLCIELIDKFLHNIEDKQQKTEIFTDIFKKIANTVYNEPLKLHFQKLIIRHLDSQNFKSFTTLEDKPEDKTEGNKFYTQLNKVILSRKPQINFYKIWGYPTSQPNSKLRLKSNLINTPELKKAIKKPFKADMLNHKY